MLILDRKDFLFKIEKEVKAKKVILKVLIPDEEGRLMTTGGRYKELTFKNEDDFVEYKVAKNFEVNTLFNKEIKGNKVNADTLEYYTNIMILIDMLDNFTIGIYNRKGGVGKSLITYMFAKAFNFRVKDVDPYSTLTGRLENVDEIDGDKKIIIPTEGKWIIDYASKAYPREKEQFEQMDVLIIPTGVIEDIAPATEMMLHDFKDVETPIIFTFNKVEKRDEEDVKMEFKNFSSFLPYGANIGYLPNSGAVKTSLKKQKGIVELAQQGGLVGSNNRNMALKIIDLFVTTLLTAEGEVTNA